MPSIFYSSRRRRHLNREEVDSGKYILRFIAIESLIELRLFTLLSFILVHYFVQCVT